MGRSRSGAYADWTGLKGGGPARGRCFFGAFLGLVSRLSLLLLRVVVMFFLGSFLSRCLWVVYKAPPIAFRNEPRMTGDFENKTARSG